MENKRFRYIGLELDYSDENVAKLYIHFEDTDPHAYDLQTLIFHAHEFVRSLNNNFESDSK